MYNNQIDCGAMLRQINDIMEKNANNALRGQDLTLSQAGLLVELDKTENKSATFKELEKLFGVAQPTIVGIIKRLEQKGWIETLNDKSDKRIKIAHLTETGHAKCQTGYEHMKHAEENLLHALTLEEQKEFALLLTKIKDSMQ